MSNNYITNKLLTSAKKCAKIGVNWLLSLFLPQSSLARKLEAISAEQFTEIASFCKDQPAGNCFSVFAYQNPIVKEAIRQLKYRRQKNIGEMLGQALAPFFEEKLESLKLFENFEKPVLLPIPITKEKRRERGYNQCEVIAESLVKNLPENFLEYRPLAIKKIKETESQAKTAGRTKRLENLSGCFLAEKTLVSGRSIIILDDVITTGATVEEARLALTRAGAKKIFAISVAH